MTWFKVDDSFHDHHKVFDAPDCAVALWTRAGSWSSRNRKGGFVPTGMPARLCDDPETAVKELVRRGLWHRTSGGYRFHDWADYQPTEAEAKAAQAKQSSGGALGNHRRWHIGQGKTAPDCRYCQDENLSESASGQSDLPSEQKPVDNSENRDEPNSDQQESGSGTRSATDSGSDRVSKSGTNPPVPTRPDPTQGRGSSKRSTHVARDPGPEPPTRCPKHQHDPDPPNCGPCGSARKAHNRWEPAHATWLRDAPKCSTHRGQPAHNCALCRAEQLGH